MLFYLHLIKDLLSYLINNCTNTLTCINWYEFNSHSSAIVFLAISNYLLGSANLVVTNNYIFDCNLLFEKNSNIILYKILIYLNQ